MMTSTRPYRSRAVVRALATEVGSVMLHFTGRCLCDDWNEGWRMKLVVVKECGVVRKWEVSAWPIREVEPRRSIDFGDIAMYEQVGEGDTAERGGKTRRGPELGGANNSSCRCGYGRANVAAAASDFGSASWIIILVFRKMSKNSLQFLPLSSRVS